MNHTSAPWKRTGARIQSANNDRLSIAHLAIAYDGDYSPANGDLIAASPELYEIVRKFEDLIHCHKDAVHLLGVQLALEGLAKEARALLDRIEGGAA